MADILKYRIPGQVIVERSGQFILKPLDQIQTGFIVSDFKGEKFYHFEEGNDEKEFHFNLEVPVVYTEREYLEKATSFLGQIKERDLNKAIFSRIKKTDFDISKIDLFFSELEKHYPNSFVYLLSSSVLGTWIGASPEILLHIQKNVSQSISLAGTKRADDFSYWGEKEILEQNYVTEFIKFKLFELGIEGLEISETNEYLAGPVKHLRTVFNWKSNPSKTVKILKTLHPTPAVSGFPRESALGLIDEVEIHDRSLYAGMIGLIGQEETHVFVNLRCCQIQNGFAYLYLGGGFTVDSNVKAEWEETENKSKTLLNVIQNL